MPDPTAAELLRAAVGPELPEAAVAALTDRTEGWAAGLQLAALSLQGRGDIAAFVEGFSKLNASTTNSSPSASLADSAERMASLTSLLFTRNA